MRGNPVPYGDSQSLNIDENNCDLSIELAIDVATYFGIAPPQLVPLHRGSAI